jgi:hypothetical protein
MDGSCPLLFLYKCIRKTRKLLFNSVLSLKNQVGGMLNEVIWQYEGY